MLSARNETGEHDSFVLFMESSLFQESCLEEVPVAEPSILRAHKPSFSRRRQVCRSISDVVHDNSSEIGLFESRARIDDLSSRNTSNYEDEEDEESKARVLKNKPYGKCVTVD